MNFIDYIDYLNNTKFDMYWFFNTKTNNPEVEMTSIFDIDDYDKTKLEIGKTYTFKVDDLSVNDSSDGTKDDYESYIKNKDEITIIINWMKVCDSDEDGIDCNVGFSFVN